MRAFLRCRSTSVAKGFTHLGWSSQVCFLANQAPLDLARALSRKPSDKADRPGQKERHEATTRPQHRRRFPAEIIIHAVWLNHVFSLSLRNLELLLAERGFLVSYETVQRWCRKIGQSFANHLRTGGQGLAISGNWARCIRIQGVQHYLWRAVDQDGVLLDILVQETPRRESSQAFLQAPTEASALCSAGNRNRQADELWAWRPTHPA